MLRLEKITDKNRGEILALTVDSTQKDFAADNAQSLEEAQTAIRAGGHAFPFGVYDGSEAVGFVMIGFGTDDEWEYPPEIAKGNYNIWRLMIDKAHQGKGFGKGALTLALDFVRTSPCAKSECCWVSYSPKNEAAKNLYRSFGFTETGETIDGEDIAVLKL